MIHFVGAGPGAPDLITIRGQKLLAKADVIIYAGSLVNPALLEVKNLGISLNTVKSYLENIFSKLHISSRSELDMFVNR